MNSNYVKLKQTRQDKTRQDWATTLNVGQEEVRLEIVYQTREVDAL